MTNSNNSPTSEITMNNKISAGADFSKEMIQYATLGAVFQTIFGLFSSVGGFLKGNIALWQDYVLLVTPLVVLVLGLIGLVLLRRGKPAQGTSLVFVVNLILPLVAILLQAGLGLAVFVYALTSSILLIWRAMPNVTRRWAFILTTLTLVLIAAMEWFNPSLRVAAGAELSVFFYVASVVLAAIFLVQSARPAWDAIVGSIINRLTVLVLVVTLPLLIGITAYISNRAGNEIQTQALHTLEDHNQSLAINVSTWLEQHVRTVKEMSTLPDITSMNAERQKATLKVVANARPNLFLVHTLDLNGMNIARNDDAAPINYSDRAWFASAKQGEPVSFDVVISRTIGKPVLAIAAPIYNQSEIVGVAAMISELTEISEELLDVEARRGITYIVDANNRVVAHPDPAYTEGELRDLSAYPPVIALREGTTGKFTFTDENGIVWVAYTTRLENGWGIISQQPETELLAPVRQFQTVSIILILISSAVMFALAWFAIRRSLQPIGDLTTTASAIAAGDLNRTADITSRDEIGVLASTFNNMTAQLRETLQGLEQRVAERTRNLELAAEVGRSVSQVRALDVMLKDAAELIRSNFDLYYVQVYLVNQARNGLQLEAGTGSVGAELLSRRHSLPLNVDSINGRAVVEKRSVVIDDTTSSFTFRPNPLLPETRSEMAVPLIVNQNVVGVLDLQSRTAGSLSHDDLPAFEALAGQLAIAIQNANLLAEAEQAHAEVEKQARRLVRQGWTEHLDAIHKPEILGFVYDGGQLAPLTEAQPDPEGALSAPIAVTGETLGSLVVEVDESRREQSAALVQIVARQVAQQVENLRLLESAERYRFEAERAARLQTLQGWQEYISTRPADSLGYLYDQKEVRPYSPELPTAEAVVTLPIKAREEVVGKLEVQGLTSADSDAVELAGAVSERLGAHIENLRLFEETRRGQFELDKRARQLAAVAKISTASSQELDVQKMLETVVFLTQRQFRLYHAHVFTLDEGRQELRIAACGWKEGDEHEGTHGTTTIPLAQEQSLVARAARTRLAVLVNDVQNEPGWLPNPLLPDTRSELAVPLLIGERLLGVLDVQSDQLNAFTEDDANIQLTLASQVAIALQNAYSFAQAQKQAEREALLNTINQKIQSATSVEAVLQIAARELGHALNVPRTIAQISLRDQK